MKIAMMSAWNETSGVSVHAELVGREWVKMGHELKVFSFVENDFHGHSLIGEDEEFVIRCFGTSLQSNYLNPIPFLREDYDFLIVQDLEMLPMDKLAKIFPHIKRKAKTVLIFHAARLPDNPSFYQFDWDAVVCFDHRYVQFLKDVYPGIIHIIPFPCHPWAPGNKQEAREKLGLPQNKKIIFTFGQKWRHMFNLVPAIKELGQKFPILMLIVSNAQRVFGFEGLEVEARKLVLDIKEVYRYLHAADCLVLGKQSAGGAVISSTAHLCLGSGCPIVARDSDFFELMDKEVLKYKTEEEFKQVLARVFEHDLSITATLQAAKKYCETNSAEKIAERFVHLLESL